MADRVIVVGAKRARQAVPISEIKQMVGRGGRKHDDSVCLATVVVESELADDVERGMEDSESFVVESSMSDSDTFAFHILPEICNEKVTDEVTAAIWYERSFAKFQGQKPNIPKSIKMLEVCEAVGWDGDRLKATPLGKIASRLYLHPSDVWAWRDNFDMVFKQGLEDEDAALAWALGTVPYTRMAGDFGENYWHVIDQCRNEIPNTLKKAEGTIVTVTLWRYLLGGHPVGKMRNAALALRGDCSRICQSLKDLDRVMNWGKEEFFDELAWRCKRGIPNHLVELCKLSGINKGRAAYLYDIGMTDRERISLNYENVRGEVDDQFWKALRNIANGIC